MKLRIFPGHGLAGVCKVPGDKSISHRAALLGAIAHGSTDIVNFLQGADCRSTLGCLKALGVKIKESTEAVRVVGKGLGGLTEPLTVLDAGNSGTTIRLLLGILAGHDFFTVITGDDSLRRRPMARVIKPLKEMGAQIWGRANDSKAPLAVKGTSELTSITYTLPVASAQVKSAILLAGLYAQGTTQVTQPVPCRDHTERMLQAFGADVEVDGMTVRIKGGKDLHAQKVMVPGDISAASFLLVAGSVVPGSDILIRDVGINPTRTGILEVLDMMGAKIDVYNERTWNGEPVADLHVQPAGLKGIRIGGELIPRVIDEIPVIAVAASVAEGTTEISDAAELRVKETDRLKAITCELQKMGVAIEEKPDGLVIRGTGRIEKATVDSWGDHRMAMALAIAGLVASGETIINDTACIDVSFPDFQETLRGLGANLENWSDDETI
ncbi:MAG TPA: 3-phosphoshikimate 1-carboxyvinyltransferase [Syntrophomonadaceae bacterium]|nr:3-phosphoshikimate 1-carboxyvinyltransferase [Syntrophomonadaceae bacterium]